MAFSKIFGGSGSKKLQKRAEELLLKLSKSLQSASAKLHVGAKAWAENNIGTLEEIVGEIIKIERESDRIKEELIDNILNRGAFLPQQTQEKHKLIIHMDTVIDACEDAIRLMWVGRNKQAPKLIIEIAEKCWRCTDLLQDAIKYLYSDFAKTIGLSREIDKVREEARDLKFRLYERLFNDSECSPKNAQYFYVLARRIIEVALRSEEAADFIRSLVMKYS